MSTTGQPTTFSDLFTDLLNRMRGDTTASGSIVLAKRYVNMANHDLHIQQNWPWAERPATVVTRPVYSTGNISIQAATRTTIEGTGGTLWNTAVIGAGFNNMNLGGKVRIAGLNEVYQVSAVASNTSATLATRFVGSISTASAYALAYGTYTYFEDEYALASDFFRVIDMRSFSDVLNIPLLGSQEFYRRYPRNATRSGSPERATIIELGPGTTTDWRPRVVFHPYPDTAYVIPYRYMTRNLAVSSAGVGQTDMVADTDEPIVPVRYRHVLTVYGAFIWYRDRKDDQRSQEAYGEYVDLVKRMAGDSAPQRDNPRLIPARMRAKPFMARRGSSRFTTGTNWDELRE